MSSKPKGLGRGLGAIFEIENKDMPRQGGNSFELLAVGQIRPNPKQPRSHFDEDALQELSESIRTLGVIQPITVRKEAGGGYMLISGERRWRAAQLAGVETVPVYIRPEVDDQTLLEMAIVENVQREDLNAIEVALSLRRLVEECNLTQDMLGERIGKKRSTVANYMRLLKLPAEVQLALREELITMGHARALAGVGDARKQISLLKKIVRKGLSVRQTEELVAALATPKFVHDEPDEEFPEEYTRLVEQLEKAFTSQISIRRNSKGGGRITIGFDSDEDIRNILRKLDESVQ